MTDHALHKHDCPDCVYLGSITLHPHSGGRDMHVCQDDFQSINYVVRRSSDGPDYTSGIHEVGADPYATVAHLLADRRGLAVSLTDIEAQGYGCNVNIVKILEGWPTS